MSTTRAERIFRSLNSNIDIEYDDGLVIGVEDIDDTEGRIFRVAYYSTPGGGRAVAFCLENPHPTNPYSFAQGHVRPADGLLCLCAGTTDDVHQSPIGLRKAIERTRYWAVAFSHLLETGEWVDP